ncbi:MAG: S24/S26 family peptidase [Pseudomonadota bacterium]
MYKLFRVRGRSMLPTLEDGDFVLARRLPRRAKAALRRDSIVCLRHREHGSLIKRIDQVDAESSLASVVSDGQTGTGSDTLGDIPLAHITHVAKLVIGRRRGLRRL